MATDLYHLALITLFFAVFLAVEWAWMWWSGHASPAARRLARRMARIAGRDAPAPAQTALDKHLSSNAPGLERLANLLPRLRELEWLIEQSGVGVRLGAVLKVALLAAALFGGSAWAVSASPFWGLLAAALGAGAPVGFLLNRRAARRVKFEAQLPDALDLISRALSAGHAFQGALQLAADDLPAPAGELFGRACDEIRYGLPMPDALQKLARRMPSTDLAFFVIAVLIQRETGGNLGEVLGNISHIIRERIKLQSRVAALSAEARFSGVVLCVLPFVTGGALYAIDAEFMSALWQEESGRALLKVAAIAMTAGALWMRKIISP